MINEAEQSGQKLMMDALTDLIADPTAKINMNKVAAKAGLSHSLFRKASYRDIKNKVITAQETRTVELQNKSNEGQIAELTLKLATANKKIEKLIVELQKPSPKTIKETEGAMMKNLVEMYRYNDLLRAELAERHSQDIDKETGEIININFQKRR